MTKHFTFLILLLSSLFAGTAFAQSRNPFEAATNNEDEVVHLAQWQRQASRPGELLVKFRDRSDIKLAVDAKGKALNRFVSPTKSLAINAVLDSFAIDTIEQLLPAYKMPKAARVSKSYGGGDVVERDLSQWHLIKTESGERKAESEADASLSTNVYELMEALRKLPEVEAVEPNYICYALGEVGCENGEVRCENGMLKNNAITDATAVASSPISHLRSSFKSGSATFNDPLYSQQWGIAACHIDSLLTAPKLDTTWRPIIAIIDTGVDIDHSDLEDNIWTNTAEADGAAGQDDDGNGFADDVHGWDFVNQTAEMHDFNSHGTHCAGIAGAVTGNGIGIAGACPDALIMPVTVLQSDGSGDIATTVRGINYAAQNGADVISMSLGSAARSSAMEQALAVAYQTAVIVAAAGNDHYHIQKQICKEDHCVPMFPGAFSFVLGVQATGQSPDPDGNGMLTSFSNIDNDGGPLSSSFAAENQLYNYELSAPGSGIMSTVPNGGYRSFNGTSMACPLVAGGIASLLQRRSYPTWEVMWGALINYSTEFYPVDFWTVYNADSIAPASLQCVSIEVNDTAYGDSSMYADAGERVQLYPTIRTVWGPCDSIYIWLEFQEFEDTNTIEMLSDKVPFVWPLSSYAHSKSLNPIDIRIAPTVVDGRRIKLTLCAATTDAQDTMRHDFTLQVTNGVKLHGMIQGNYTLYPNVHYIVTNNVALPSGDTLFIKPGTTVKIKDGCSINATIMAIGKPDSMITFTKTDLGGPWKEIISANGCFDYCVFEHNSPFSGNYILRDARYVSNSILRNQYGSTLEGYFLINVSQCIYTNYVNNPCHQAKFGDYVAYCNIINNFCRANGNPPYQRGALRIDVTWWGFGMDLTDKYQFNNIFNNSPNNLFSYGSEVGNVIIDTNYYGSAVESVIRRNVYDFNTPGSQTFVYINFNKRASRPSPLAHGIVWKVLVNGFDPQDEADSVEYLGVGTHRFDVYFNRAMDTNITPILAMGVRPPYTQTPINKNASWSADSTVYTAYLTLTGRDAIDGVNRIYVSGAQDDEHFEIPYENQRFEVQVASSGSMSAGFQATPGIGKVDLEWNDQEVNYADFLGFNIYRYQYDSVIIRNQWGTPTDTVWMPVDTIRLNQTLVQDTVFTDFDVVPGERYYYFYKILSTSLTENSPSKTVSCVPHSSIRGDANGSYAVDVADVITTINYVTGQNPQPFLFDAADVNGDGTINVLDIVGIINIILYGDQGKSDYEQQTAIYTVENDTLYINTPVALGGLQFNIANCTYDDIELLEAMKGFEVVHVTNPDGTLTLLAYSMSGKTVPAGKSALMRLGGNELNDITLSDPNGHNVIALKGGTVGITDAETLPAQIMKAFPNPFSNEVHLDITVGTQAATLQSGDVMLVFTDIAGRRVHTATVGTPVAGRYSYTWNATAMPKGVYFATLYLNNAAAHTVKLVLK